VATPYRDGIYLIIFLAMADDDDVAGAQGSAVAGVGDPGHLTTSKIDDY
jgi:hypothetical protein